MRGWLTLWGLPWGGEGMSAEHARMMGMATPEELGHLDTLPPAAAERHFLGALASWSAERTLVIATHRMRVLDVVSRIIVVDGGGIILDGARDGVLRAMRKAQGVAA